MSENFPRPDDSYEREVAQEKIEAAEDRYRQAMSDKPAQDSDAP